MQVKASEVASKKVVGTLEGKDVYEVALIGGLHVVGTLKAGKLEPLGTGPHRAVARHIAKKRAPEIEYNEIAKSEQWPEESFRDLLPAYEKLTDELIKASKG